MIEFLTIWLILVLNPIAAGIMIMATMKNRALQAASVWHRLGVLIAACGLLGQFGHNLVFALTGSDPRYLEMPLWALKDYGLIILAFHFAHLGFVEGRDGG